MIATDIVDWLFDEFRYGLQRIVRENFFRPLGKYQFLLGMPPDRPVDHGDHWPCLVGVVGHAAVPEAHVADEHATDGNTRLHGWAFISSSVLGFGWDLDIVPLDNSGIEMGAGPEFGATVLGCGIDDGYVDDEVVGRGRLGEVGPELARVDVEGLMVGAGQAGVAAVEGVFDALAEHGRTQFGNQVVDQYIAEKIGGKGRWILLQMAVVELLGYVVKSEDGVDIGDHAFAQDFDVGGIDGTVEDDEAIGADCGEGSLQMLRCQFASIALCGAEFQLDHQNQAQAG